MLNQLLRLKLKNRVNKLDSLDYGLVEPWIQAEVLNKAQSDWVRRQLEGVNQEKTGNEASIRRIDDLQQLLSTWTGSFTDRGQFWQSETWPSNYMEWCRIDVQGQDDCKKCPPRNMTIFMGNEADVSIYLSDKYRTPNYEWATTFATVANNTFKIWTNDQFDLVDPLVTFYRAPQTIVFIGTLDPYTNTVSPVDIPCEFPDNIAEIIVDEAAAILIGDIDDYMKNKLLVERAEHNT